MKVIIHQGANHFKNRKCQGTTQDSLILKYIKQHKFFNELLSVEQILEQIKQKVRSNASENNQIKNRMEQLSLYLNNQKNKSMFQIYEIVLKNPKGVTYKTIDNKLKIGIVSVSHYCCRLKKMNFVDLRHEKNEKVVFSKDVNCKKTYQQQDEATKKSEIQPFHFRQLSMVDNIWINVSSYESYKKNGITNEDIKQKLNKNSETKLIMKLVDQVKDIYKFDKQIVSEGKVFENRFRNITKQIIKISKGQLLNQQNQIQQKLNPKIQDWLKQKFPQHNDRKFLFNLVNTELKDYLTVDGLKSAKRDCTPIKLIRYIKILNSLNNRYPQTHIQLKNYIIDEQKQSLNGTMHKRSILGILDGLVTKGILKKNSIYYYPLWQAQGIQVPIQKNQQQEYNEAILSKPIKKIKLSSLTTKKQIGNKVNLNQYKKQLKIKLFCVILEQYQKLNIKKSFNKIRRIKIYQQNKNKNQIKIYEPGIHILHYLEADNYRKLPKLKVNNYEELIYKIDNFIEREGVKEDKINVNYQIIRILRKAGKIKETQLKNRFGSSWQDKISPLLQHQIIKESQDGVWSLQDNQQRYFL